MNKILIFLLLVLFCCSSVHSVPISKEEAKEILNSLDKQLYLKDFNFTAGESDNLKFNILDLEDNQQAIDKYAEIVGLP